MAMSLDSTEITKIDTQKFDVITRTESSSLLGAVFLGFLGEFPGGSTLSSIIGWKNDKKQAEQLDNRLHELNAELYAFKKEIEDKVNKILESRLTMPHMHLFGLALESAKYYYKQNDMRKLFANLIAKLFDAEMYKVLHPAYIEIIKQLSPLDAKLLAEFRPKTPQRIGMSVSMKRYIVKDGRNIRVDNDDNEIADVDEGPPPILDDDSQLIGYSFPKVVKPLVSYLIVDKASKNTEFLQDNVVKTDVTSDITLISASVTNLVRLGLIEIDFGMTARVKDGSNDVYKCFLEKPLLPNWQELSVHPLLRVIQVAGLPNNYDAISETKSLELRKGVAQLTQFGFNFISACVIESEFSKE